MLITSQVQEQFELKMPLLAAHAALADIEASGKVLPDVESITRIGPGLYAWTMLPRRAFGVTFNGSYVSQYIVTDDRISWDHVSGNMLSKGSFTLTEHDGGTTVLVDMQQEVDLPVPAMMVPTLQLYTRQKIAKGVVAIFKLLSAPAAHASLHDMPR